MKIFLLFALLGLATTITTATVQFDPSGHGVQRPQQSYPQWQPVPQQQPFPQQDPQQQLLPQQQPFSQQQQLPQQHPFPQQMPLLPQPPQFPQQQPFAQPQQPLTQQPYPQEQPLSQQQPSVEEQQQLNVCKEFLLQQCNPNEKVSSLQSVIPFLRPQTWQQNSCQLKRQQCCRQLANINEQSRCPAIQTIVHAIVMQQQQVQQQVGHGFIQSQPQQLGQGMPIYPQQQPGHGFFLPQQQAQSFNLVRSLVIQTLPMLCNVHVPPYCSTTTAPFGSMPTGIGGQ
uniref:Gamma 3 hordein n=1 Tax=Hordeum chilense TaxID=15565 RepID=Q6EEZ0_HORCH|nr:gamma 3 hordein [Hordeum chilense]AAQ63844.1 gamma 3 hordein [Hordeum chilense]AAQ63846.1 gamma 3 hordein [Hordeum chilense]AAQ63847.1 gamma 3 hordein [Hordeum chilense]